MSTKPNDSGFFARIVESAPDAMIVVDADGTMIVANGQAETLFGYKRDELVGKKVEMLVPTRVRERHSRLRDAYARNPHARLMGAGQELYGRRRDGSEFPAEISLSPVKSGDVHYVSSAIRDVSARKELEDELIGARKEAERANKANSAFLAAASHDLRQPVQALSLLSGALRRTVTNPKALEMIEIQDQSLTAMKNLLNSLLDISRLDAGAITPEFEEFSVDQIFSRFSAEFSRQAAQEGLIFNCEESSVVVRSDANLLSEILQNLISNAIRYTDEGTVMMRARVHGETCHVSVADTGIGIDEDQLQRIFEEFHQCHRSSSRPEGFGLGLAIVRRLVDLLGHELLVESKVGEGSTFTVVLPVVPLHVGCADVETPGPVTTDLQADSKVILVEDDRQVANALRMLFESLGVDVQAAVSAAEAIEIVASGDFVPDLIVSDYHLVGNETGIETIGLIRSATGRNIPALLISGDTSELSQEVGNCENCAVMNKPVDPEALLQIASRAFSDGVIE